MPPSIHERRTRRKVLSLLLYACVAALGEALVARPALLFARGLGIFETVLPWRVPFGGLQLILAVSLAICALSLATRAALGKPPRLALNAALLILLALALGVRANAAAPLPPVDPLPALLTGLRIAAGATERGLDSKAIDAELARLEPPGFARFARRLRMRTSGDEPGAIVISRSENVIRLRVRGLNGFAALNGHPAVIEVRAGTHSEPGRDPLLPAYPGMRLLTTR